MGDASFRVELRQLQDFRFMVQFDRPQLLPLVIDESPPLGADAGPNPARLRIPRIAVELRVGLPWQELKHADRALAQFEDFCIVTQSVRGGIDVSVRLLDAAGELPPPSLPILA